MPEYYGIDLIAVEEKYGANPAKPDSFQHPLGDIRGY
jgi:hypothetical protein